MGAASPLWSSWEPSDLSGLDEDDPPLAWCRMSFERIVGTVISRLFSRHYHCNYGTWLVLHWSVRYKATKMGVSMVFQEAKVYPLKKQRNWQHGFWCLITNTRANRVGIVSSVITKIFNPCKYWTQPSVYIFSESVFVFLPRQFTVIVQLLFNFHLLLFFFCSFRPVQLFSALFFV
jgi:hypothetical protein